jgi:predicted permease
VAISLRLFRPALLADIRYALRRWRHRPGFAATAILTLGLGIAAATSIFSVVDAVLLRPLPWVNPESLVIVHGVYPERRNSPATAPTWNRWYLSYPGWDALRTAASFQTVGAYTYIASTDLTFGEDRTEVVTHLDLSSNFLPMLGVKLVLGRYFTEQEDNVSTQSIILTEEIWRRRFGARPDVIGERLMTGSASSGGRYPRTIVGVIEAGFRFEGVTPDVLLPIGIPAEVSRKYPSPSLRVVARLAPGVSLAAADAQSAALVSAAPNQAAPTTARLVTLEEEQVGSTRRPLWLLFGGAGILLLVACSNVAGLLLGEARVRRHEIAVRSALGGSRARVLRQFVVEHALLAIAGAVVGLTAAYWLIGVLVAVAPTGMPRIEAAAIDLRAIVFAVTCGFVTLLTFGVAPALSLSRTPVAGVLAEGGRDGGVSRVLGQRLIVVGQVALALVLLTGATLFGETMLRLHEQPLGFDPRGVAVVSTTFTGSPLGDPARFKEIMDAARQSGNPGRGYDRLMTETASARNATVLDRLGAVPGVTSAAVSSAVPFIVNPGRQQIVLEGRPDAERHETALHTVSEHYFATMGMTLLSGRGFHPADAGGDVRAVVVSSEFERRFFPGGAIDRQFKMVYGERYQLSLPFRVIGVAPNVKRQDPTDDVRPAYYTYDRQSGAPRYFVIKTSGDPAAVLPSVRKAINDVSPQIVVTSMDTLDARVARSVAEERFRATLSAVFGAAALLLAAVGLYGLAARRVADRRREFGVRVALGARPGDVRRLVLRDAFVIVATGLAIGLPTSFAIAQVTRSLLFGVSATAPHVFAITVAVLGSMVMLATILPARRAGRVDPVIALRGN